MPDWAIVPRDNRDALGEGLWWSARYDALFWVDILAPALNRLSFATGRVDRWPMPGPIGWVIERTRGGFVAGIGTTLAEIEVDPLAIRIVADIEPDRPANRMNDAVADRFGRIWCGTMAKDGQGDCGALYRVDPEFGWTALDGPYRVPNGPAVSRDGRWLYHSDTPRRTVFRFRIDAAGEPGPREPFIRFEGAMGFPDGMTVDAGDGLWIAHWDGGRISRFHADGSFDRSIELPARNITNIVFAGPSLDRMFVTSAATESDGRPEDGALFEITSGAVGLRPNLFTG